MGDSYLAKRLNWLKQTQNSDGGWGYFPHKQSWLEPTVYAALALHGTPQSDRAAGLVEGWQGADGAWRPAAEVEVATSGTSLALTLAAYRQEFGPGVQKGVTWLLGNSGEETGLKNWIVTHLGLFKPDRDVNIKGWPWKPGNSAWVEPTARALVALKRLANKFPSKTLQGRVTDGEAQLLNTRCADGGWNYGAPAALGVNLPSYPETTALALAGLQGKQVEKALDGAEHMLAETPSPLARSWLTMSLRLNGRNPQDLTGDPSQDVMITALEALATREGNYRAFLTVAYNGGAA